jgi:2-polyprenyl-3-methyl-5-hydroxy-6-metoxy-1,4-benzoquinol methylase
MRSLLVQHAGARDRSGADHGATRPGSPHDLRHPRISLLHLGWTPWAAGTWQSSRVGRVVDTEGAHLAAILRAADFRGQRVLEVGSGEGRLTWGFASHAAFVLAFDPVEGDVATARAECTEELREKVRFEVARAEEIDVPPHSVDLVFFSWSL